MTKKLMIGAAVGALMVSGALAQTPGSAPSPSSSPPAAATPAPAGGAGGDKPNFVMSQKPDQWLASKFNGTDVIGSDGQKIGDVTDILFDKNGKIEAYIVSVGGFLGMGAKNVAMAPTSFQVVPGTNGASDQLKLSVSQDQLKQAENFTPYQPPRATTGAGSPAGTTRPLGGSSPTGTGR